MRNSWRCLVTELSPRVVTVAVEGSTDVPVAERLLRMAGFLPGKVYALNGKNKLDQSLGGFNNAARFSRWFVLRDLDEDAACAPELTQRLLPAPAQWMSLRIAVRAVEAWLLADREKISRFLGVSIDRIPSQHDHLENPKATLVAIAKHSRSREIREDMVPAPGTSARVGPAYASHIIEFTRDHWRPSVAASRSESLRSCVSALKRWSR